MDDLQNCMTYSAQSGETPPDPDAWHESASQPSDGYLGTVGPNPGKLLVTAKMCDNDYTPGAQDYEVNVVLDVIQAQQ
jgi:hypothetical protein